VSSASDQALAGLADLTGFPSTVTINAQYDTLRVSCEAFAAPLTQNRIASRQ